MFYAVVNAALCSFQTLQLPESHVLDSEADVFASCGLLFVLLDWGEYIKQFVLVNTQ